MGSVFFVSTLTGSALEVETLMRSVFFVSTLTGSVLEVETLMGSVFFVSTLTGSILEVETLMGSVFFVSTLTGSVFFVSILIWGALTCGAVETIFIRSASVLAAAFFFWSLFFAIFILLCLLCRINFMFHK